MDQNDLQRLGEKLILAGWATGFLIKGDEFPIVWTEKGLDRMKHLYQYLEELGGEPVSVNHIYLLVGHALVEGNRRGWSKNP